MINTNRHSRLPHGLRLLGIAAAGGLWLIFYAAFGFASPTALHHELEVEILQDTRTLRGKDTIRFPSGMSHLRVALRPGVRMLKVTGAEYVAENNALKLDLKTVDPSSNTVVLNYEGIFDDPFEDEPFSMDNPGQGVRGNIPRDAAFFLAGSGWYPLVVDDIAETFRVSVTAPRGIYAVMEGQLEAHADHGDHSISIWSIPRPSGPLAMFSGRYVVNERMDGKIRIATYFFSGNAALSTRYLDATQRHIRRYEALHGPYPFSKFAVVENFFPTGYGFPSFTLLGTRVLRLPFIPETSLRHEVAHCWWGNGVFVDPAEGNWCEGLTTYMADYLSKEEHSPGEVRGYRRRTLEKYALLASGEKDFALSEFHSRHNPASQAVGYGKAMFVFHMMRRQIGDAAFWEALREVFADRLFKDTGWRHFMAAFARHGGLSRNEMQTFYDQWITRPGAVKLALEKPRIVSSGNRLEAKGVLVQDHPRFNVRVPVKVTGNVKSQEQAVSLVDDKAAFSMLLKEPPETLAVDPDFDVFRLLYPEEIPATINALKGSGSLVAVIADNAPASWAEIFQGLLLGLSHSRVPVWNESRFAAEDTIGQDVLFFGMPEREKSRTLLSALNDDVKLSATAFQVDKQISSRNADTLFAVFKTKQRLVAVFLPIENTSAETVQRTARKITHYGRYGRLSFKDSVNIGKDVGKPSGSPLFVNLKDKR